MFLVAIGGCGQSVSGHLWVWAAFQRVSVGVFIVYLGVRGHGGLKVIVRVSVGLRGVVRVYVGVYGQG